MWWRSSSGVQHVDMATAGGDEDSPICERRLFAEMCDVTTVGHPDNGQLLRNSDEGAIASLCAILRGFVIDVRAPGPFVKRDARITKDDQMALIGSNKDNAAGYRGHTKRIQITTVIWDISDPANAVIFGRGAGIECMESAVADRKIIVD
jgi:hypothetical protein